MAKKADKESQAEDSDDGTIDFLSIVYCYSYFLALDRSLHEAPKEKQIQRKKRVTKKAATTIREIHEDSDTGKDFLHNH